MFIEDKEVKGVKDLADQKTPTGETMVEVQYDGGKTEIMPKKRYDIVSTEEQSDANEGQEAIIKEIATMFYGLLHEYGLKLNEIDPLFNRLVKMVNDGSNKANNLLWGIEYSDQRTLNMVNDILSKNYDEQKRENSDGASSDGGGSDTSDKE